MYMKVVKTIIADDHRISIEGLKSVLRKPVGILTINVVATLKSGKKLLKICEYNPPDLVILDLNLSEIDGLETLRKLRQLPQAPKALVYSRYQDPKIIKHSFRAGADGFLLKNGELDELKEGICAVLNGVTFLGKGVKTYNPSANKRMGARHSFEERHLKNYALTKRELQILQLITQALSNKEIARKLFISDQTVGVHRKNIMRKLGVSNTAALVKMAYENSLI